MLQFPAKYQTNLKVNDITFFVIYIYTYIYINIYIYIHIYIYKFMNKYFALFHHQTTVQHLFQPKLYELLSISK